MSQSIAIPHYELAGHGRTRDRARLRNLILRAVAGATIIGVGFAVALPTADFVRSAFAAPPETVAPAIVYPEREIPREWQWPPPSGNYDSMYRGVKPQRLDWIRSNGRR